MMPSKLAGKSDIKVVGSPPVSVDSTFSLGSQVICQRSFQLKSPRRVQSQARHTGGRDHVAHERGAKAAAVTAASTQDKFK